jgi:hypothetical protein
MKCVLTLTRACCKYYQILDNLDEVTVELGNDIFRNEMKAEIPTSHTHIYEGDVQNQPRGPIGAK